MKQEEQFIKDYLKQLKSPEELTDFLSLIQKRGIEQLLEGELDAHLGYEKNQVSEVNNNRNGHTSKMIRTSYGTKAINVPRDRDGSFNPIVVPKRTSIIGGIENVIVSMYAKGMSNSDIEEQIREMYNFNISTSSISKITDRVTNLTFASSNYPAFNRVV